MLCVLIYMRTSCGLRSVVEILKIFEEVLRGACGKAPAYTTVRNWMLKLGLSIYEEDKTDVQSYAMVMDESIMVNCQKLLVTLGVPSKHPGRPLTHSDVTVLDMRVSDSNKKEDVCTAAKCAISKIGHSPDYGLSDGGHNLKGGFALAGIPYHFDVSHTLGNCMKKVYAEDREFVELIQRINKMRLRYHQTDIGWLLPPNMRAIARFMNLADWVEWGNRILGVMDNLEPKAKDAFSFLKDYRKLLEELGVCVSAIRHVETICKTRGFSLETCRESSLHVVYNVIGNANNRRATLGLRILDYLRKEAALLHLTNEAQIISTDIIESDFGILKSKMSPNKLYGFTSQILMLPLYPKIIDYSVADEQDFIVRLANVKLKEIDCWAKANLSRNRVRDRTEILKKVC